MIIGCTYDEKVFNIEKLKSAISKGLKSIEISPDLSILSKSEYIDIIEFAVKYDLKINYHIPYFASARYNQKKMISNRDLVLEKYDEFYYLLSEFNKIYTSESIIVYHGEDFNLNEDKEYERTKEIIEYGLKKIGDLNLNCKIAIETIRGGLKRKIGDNHQDLLYIVEEIDSENLGICLDLCHDLMNSFPYDSIYSKNFLEKIIYIHAHGIDISNNLAHISILKSKLNLLDKIIFLNNYKSSFILNIELLSDYTGSSFFKDLFSDIKILNKIIEDI
ncbi:MAG: TIM barrel protein [Andreesenia angusta]|nr:TIM barrel protein [Andreesenia angusta]